MSLRAGPEEVSRTRHMVEYPGKRKRADAFYPEHVVEVAQHCWSEALRCCLLFPHHMLVLQTQLPISEYHSYGCRAA